MRTAPEQSPALARSYRLVCFLFREIVPPSFAPPIPIDDPWQKALAPVARCASALGQQALRHVSRSATGTSVAAVPTDRRRLPSRQRRNDVPATVREPVPNGPPFPDA